MINYKHDNNKFNNNSSSSSNCSRINNKIIKIKIQFRTIKTK